LKSQNRRRIRIFHLDEKLNNLDAMYTNRLDDMTSMQNLSTEEKLLLFQKNIELRTRENLKQQVNEIITFKKTIKIRLDGSIS
jgi:hypothetical protein